MNSSSPPAWQPAPHTLLTEWGARITPDLVWPEYPRPQLVRPNWVNLNGLWDVAITDNRSRQPQDWSRKILVPFALETPLSGVGRRLEAGEVIWYRREFTQPASRPDRTLLHFEGVDYQCLVWVNGRLAGSHQGGNSPFCFDVSPWLQTGHNTLVLRVIDGTDDPDLYQLRGKQKRVNHGIWYTPSSGIWATVWMETVPATHLGALHIVADMQGRLKVRSQLGGTPQEVRLRVGLLEAGKWIAGGVGDGPEVSLEVKNPRLWTPDTPHLYDLEIELLNRAGETIDRVQSYTGFRTVGKVRDREGNWRFTLNGREIFYLGPLDQGWWPDSFLCPPADAAIVWEMKFLKEAGFNMIRKHKKAEPRRYYYHADRLGLAIWQDQTSGGSGGIEWPKWKQLRTREGGRAETETRSPHDETDPIDADWPEWAHRQYLVELQSMIDTLRNHPSIVVWTTFNEAWGQHRTMEVGRWVSQYDPTRHLNIASGGNFCAIGDIADEHNYPDPLFPLADPLYDDYLKVVGEFGGHGWPVPGHLWDPARENWGYGGLPSSYEDYVQRYTRSAQILGELKKKGIAAGVYTQTTDVEGEINGLLTYDRKVRKIPPDRLAEIHRQAGLTEAGQLGCP